MKKVSIIVPVYNSEKYLDKCLDALCNQTLKDIEIIVVNDGSTDGSEEIIKQKMVKNPNIKLYNKKNGGQASARNFGLNKACGEYIFFVDSDDYPELDMCEKMYNAAKENNYDIVCADYFINKDGIDTYNKILPNKKSGEISIKEYMFSGVAPWMKIYKHEFLTNNHFTFPEGIIYEDFASIPTLVKFFPKIYYLNEAFLHYVHSDVSTMRTTEYKEKFEDIFVAVDYLYDNLNSCGVDEELEYLIVYHFLLLGSLNFYQYQKYDQIDKISLFVKSKFPKWNKNKYLKNNTFKEKLLMKLFYFKKYDIIKICQSIKK